MPQIAGNIADFVKYCGIIVVKLQELRPILVLVLYSVVLVVYDVRVVQHKSCMTKQNVCCADCVQLPDRTCKTAFLHPRTTLDASLIL